MLDDWLVPEGACALVEESDGCRLFCARFFLLSLLGVVVADCEDWLDDAGVWALVDEEPEGDCWFWAWPRWLLEEGACALGDGCWLWFPLCVEPC